MIGNLHVVVEFSVDNLLKVADHVEKIHPARFIAGDGGFERQRRLRRNSLRIEFQELLRGLNFQKVLLHLVAEHGQFIRLHLTGGFEVGCRLGNGHVLFAAAKERTSLRARSTDRRFWSTIVRRCLSTG